MKLSKKTLAMLLPLMLAATTAHAEADKSVSFYNWNDYIADDTLTGFTQSSGIKVQYDLFDSVDTVETKLLTGRSGYDLVMTDASRRLKRQIKAGVFQKLDKDQIANYSNIDPQVLNWISSFDQGNAYAVPYMWGTTGLGYNRDELEKRLPTNAKTGWELLLNPDIVSKLADCGVAVLDDVEELYVATLLYLGKDVQDFSKANLKLVEQHLKKIRPHIRYFNNSQYMSDLADGEVCLAVGYNGSIFMAQDRADEAGTGVNLGYIVPKEGATLWFDAIAIPVDAPNPENAHALLNHLMDGQVIAKVSNTVRFANGYSASQPYLDQDLLKNQGIYPEANVKARLVPLPEFPKRFEKQLNRMWSRVKVGN